MTTENKPQTLPAVSADGKCTACGSAGPFTLAVDSTAYMPGVRFIDGKVQSGSYVETQPSDAEDSVRFFCSICGERHQVPEELQGC